MTGRRSRILVLDHHDSFTQNLVEALRDAGAGVGTLAPSRLGLAELAAARWDGLVLSPGPGRPEDATLAIAAFRRFDGRRPMLGVCLGHQCLALAFGGRVGPARTILHGGVTQIFHDGKGLFDSIQSPLEGVRYNSLQVEPGSIDDAPVLISARDGDGEIMGLRRPHELSESFQFHPESVLSVGGGALLRNFVARVGDVRSKRPSAMAGVR